MKNINLRSVILIVSLLAIITTQSCKKEDQPTPVVYKAFTVPVLSTSPATKADGTVFVTGSTVDLKWVSETGGNADNWTVYVSSDAGDDTTYKGVTTQSFALPVEDGVHYTWHVEALDRNGIITTSPEQSFTAIKGTNPEMSVALGVTTDVKTVVGMDLTADQVVDLRLLLIRKSDMKLLMAVDNGNANELYDGFDTLVDGEYLIAVDIFSTKNFGDFNKPISLSFTLDFEQLGIISTELPYPNVMNNQNACDLYRTNLATVTKVGSVYTIVSSVSKWVSPDANPNSPALAGIWGGFDAFLDYPSEVVSEITDGKLKFTGIGRGWMQDAWEEVITKEYPISMNFNFCAGTLIIPKQKIMETTWKGDPQTFYSIQGTGTVDMSGDYPSMLIEYDFIQGSNSIAAQFKLDSFTLEISLDPGKKKPINSGMKGLPIHPKR